LRRAAELAAGRYEIDDALVMLHRALELEADEGGQLDLWRAIGHANALKFDGEAFWTAMQQAIALSSDRETTAALYAELAFDTVARSGMWKHLPERALVDGWIDQALELSEPDSRTRARAMISRCYLADEKEGDLAREASALADRLGDLELRSYALDARIITAFGASRFDEALNWAQRRLDLVEQIADPDHAADIYASAIPVCVMAGRFREARRLASQHDGLASKLTPHHEVHGVGVLLEVEELAAAWDTVSELTRRTEEAVAGNLDTPCVRNSRSLLICAVGSAALGDDETAGRLETRAEEVELEGHEHTLVGPRIRLALVRRDLDLAGRLVEASFGMRKGYWYSLSAVAAQLDALATLGDRHQAELLALPLIGTETYFAPFASRALGVVREDEDLIRQALERFEALKLDWHAAQTRALL
jgi:hypothetical protein